jgi:ferredoxin
MPGWGRKKGWGLGKGRGRGRGWRRFKITGAGFQPIPRRQFPRQVPTVNEKKCIGCGQCAKSCPAGAITIVNKKAKIEPTLCLGCGLCVRECPKGALSLLP